MSAVTSDPGNNDLSHHDKAPPPPLCSNQKNGFSLFYHLPFSHDCSSLCVCSFLLQCTPHAFHSIFIIKKSPGAGAVGRSSHILCRFGAADEIAIFEEGKTFLYVNAFTDEILHILFK